MPADTPADDSTNQLPPLPKFLIIGAQKSATRWLRLNLGRHPSIYTPEIELNFFTSRSFTRGPLWYRAQFTGWAGERITGEATPGYMIPRLKPVRTARRIDETLPDVRLIAILRNPVDRLYSAYIHHMRRGRIALQESLTDRINRIPPDEDQQQLIAGSMYAQGLAPYVERFGDRLLVVLNEDSKRDPAGTYRSALEHIGNVDVDFVPAELTEVVFSRQPPAGSLYENSGLPSEERNSLLPLFSDEIDRLEELIGRDLSSWREPRA